MRSYRSSGSWGVLSTRLSSSRGLRGAGLQELADGAVQPRHRSLGAQFRKSLQHEAALVEVRMGHGERLGTHLAVAVEEQVEVDSARPPLLPPDASQAALQVEQSFEKRGGIQLGLDLRDGVEEGGLVGAA